MFDPYRPYEPYGRPRKEQIMEDHNAKYTHLSQLGQQRNQQLNQQLNQLSEGTASSKQQELGLRELLDRIEQTQYAIAEKTDQLEHVIVSVVGTFPNTPSNEPVSRDRESLRDIARVLLSNNEVALQRFADLLLALNRGI